MDKSIEPIFIGIAGGTGAGKSTVAFSLLDKNPDKISILHFDDYHYLTKEPVPITEGMTNWDHPDAINWEKLLADLRALKEGRSIITLTKNERDNPRYKEIGRIQKQVDSKPIVIVEGFLSLYNPKARQYFSKTIFLDLDSNTRMKRRTKFLNDDYLEHILIPMHKKYVEPTKQFADYVIDVSALAPTEALEIVERILHGR